MSSWDIGSVWFRRVFPIPFLVEGYGHIKSVYYILIMRDKAGDLRVFKRMYPVSIDHHSVSEYGISSWSYQ